MKITPNILYEILLDELGIQKWWPVDSSYHKNHSSDPRFEVMVGAILTQNTAWSNVEKALTNLKIKKILEIEKISNIDLEHLREMIKPSGFFNQKAQRIKNLASHLHNNYHSDLNCFFDQELFIIRNELLSLNGIGPETADSILLYAGNFPIFVVDAYTKRICKRLPIKAGDSYDEIQLFFQRELNKKYNTEKLTQIYNELHALIVIFVKNYCKKRPECCKCPIRKYCNF